jgi:hypothetical protein
MKTAAEIAAAVTEGVYLYSAKLMVSWEEVLILRYPTAIHYLRAKRLRK